MFTSTVRTEANDNHSTNERKVTFQMEFTHQLEMSLTPNLSYCSFMENETH